MKNHYYVPPHTVAYIDTDNEDEYEALVQQLKMLKDKRSKIQHQILHIEDNIYPSWVHRSNMMQYERSKHLLSYLSTYQCIRKQQDKRCIGSNSVIATYNLFTKIIEYLYLLVVSKFKNITATAVYFTNSFLTYYSSTRELLQDITFHPRR